MEVAVPPATPTNPQIQSLTTPEMKISTISSEYMTNRKISEVRDTFMFAGRGDVTDEDRRTYKLLLTSNEIQLCVKSIAQYINKKFAGQNIILLGILKGVYMFMADLSKYLTIPYSVGFITASSYDGQKQSTQVKCSMGLDPKSFQKGSKIILLDELFDHGKTMDTIRQQVMSMLNIPRSDILTCTLFKKIKKTKYSPPDLVGFDIFPDIWLVGYGLDELGHKRGWSHVFGVPKAAGLPRVPEDDIFDANIEADYKYEELRARFRAKLAEISKT